jgi:hypothetical protein
MRSSFERAKTVAAASLALAVGIGEVTTAKALATSTPPKLVRLARQIDAQPTVTGKTSQSANFSGSLPGGEVTNMSVGSPDVVNGKPNPKAVSQLSINVGPNKDYVTQDESPIIDVSFTKMPDGKWNAYKTVGTPFDPDEWIQTEEIEQSSVEFYDQTVTSAGITTSDAVQLHDSQYANVLLNSLEVRAEDVLQSIIHNHAVERLPLAR